MASARKSSLALGKYRGRGACLCAAAFFPRSGDRGAALDRFHRALPEATLAACRDADAVLLGAVGGPRWESGDWPERPEQGLLALRKALGVYANIRPLRVFPALASMSALREERLQGVDFIIVRELVSGIYFGERSEGPEEAFDVCRYRRDEIERTARVAAAIARRRRGLVTQVDKANVLASSASGEARSHPPRGGVSRAQARASAR